MNGAGGQGGNSQFGLGMGSGFGGMQNMQFGQTKPMQVNQQDPWGMLNQPMTKPMFTGMEGGVGEGGKPDFGPFPPAGGMPPDKFDPASLSRSTQAFLGRGPEQTQYPFQNGPAAPSYPGGMTPGFGPLPPNGFDQGNQMPDIFGQDIFGRPTMGNPFARGMGRRY